MPSEGCGTASDPPATLNVANEYIVTFPPSYDGTTPIPLIFGMHGAGRTNTDFRQTDARMQDSELEATYIMAYPKSSGSDWTGQLSTNIGRVEALHELLLADYCVDTSRVFATGHSSGAQFTTEFHCQRDGILRAVAPVAGSEFGNNCASIPTLIIHGENDSVRGNNGSAHVEKYRDWNACGSMTMPYEVASCNSAAGGAQVDPGCVEYQECGATLIWCSHDDPNYNGGTNHGWPCFANDAILDFFTSFQ